MRKFQFMIDINLKRSFTFHSSTNYTPAIYLSLIKVYGSCNTCFVICGTSNTHFLVISLHCFCISNAHQHKIYKLTVYTDEHSMEPTQNKTTLYMYYSTGMWKGGKVVYDQHKNKC